MKKKLFLGIVALLLAVAIALPFLSADRFKNRIHAALEQGLRRRVDISGKVGFALWNGPGFSIEGVVIHEDPRVGIEPFAYVATLNARVNLLSLLGGRWEVSSILLDEPTVNLVKRPDGWNIRPLLSRTALAGENGVKPSPLPEIKVRSGRINFKFDETKTVLYGSNADLDVEVLSESDIRIRFKLEPARTDRAAQGFGMFSGFGRYRRFSDKPAEIDFEVELERSALSEIATLLEGRGAGLRGFLASKATLKGPLSNIAIEGSLGLEGIQSFDLLRTSGGKSRIPYQGVFNLPDGELDLQTRSEGQPPTFRLRLKAHELLASPRWGTIVEFNRFPVTALREVFQYLEVSMPDRVSLEGNLNGVLGYSPAHGMQGLVGMPEATAKAAAFDAKLRDAVLVVDGSEFRLRPAFLELPDGQTAQIEGRYSSTSESFSWRTGGRPVALRALISSLKTLLGIAAVAPLETFEGGFWQGAIRYERSVDHPAVWSGGFVLQDTGVRVDGVAEPIRIKSAGGTLREGRLSLQSVLASAGSIEFRAGLQAGPTRTGLTVIVPEADAAELERLLLPSLRRAPGLLRTLSLRSAPVPDWLRQRRLDVNVNLQSLMSGDLWLGAVQGRLHWNATKIESEELVWTREDTAASARLTVLLNDPEPEYRLVADLRNIPWKGGLVEGLTEIETSGTGAAIVRNAKASGKFTARGLDLGPESEFESVTGAYEFATPRLKFTGVEATAGTDIFTGQGTTENDGRLFVDLTSGKKRMRIAGTLWPFQLEPAAH